MLTFLSFLQYSRVMNIPMLAKGGQVCGSL